MVLVLILLKANPPGKNSFDRKIIKVKVACNSIPQPITILSKLQEFLKIIVPYYPFPPELYLQLLYT